MDANMRSEPRTFRYGHQNRVSQQGSGQTDGIYFIPGRNTETGHLAAPTPSPPSSPPPVPSPPQPLPEDKPLLEEAIRLHDKGIAGDKEAVNQAYKLLQELHSAEPYNSLIKGYLGSTTALIGRDAIDPLLRMSKALEGLKILDGALLASPEDIRLRTLRGYVCYKLPEMYFHRTKTAVEDFSYLVSRYEQDPGAIAQNFYWQLLFDLGMAYKNINNLSAAEEVWSKLLEQSKEAKFVALLRREGFKPALAMDVTPAVPDQEKKKLTKEALEAYTKALAGDKTAKIQALDLLSKAADTDPGDNVLAACYADFLSFKSRDAAEPGEMFASAIKAMKLLDQSVNAEPDNPRIRLIRAGHSLRLPEAFFKRTATAVSDLEYLTELWEKDNSAMPKEQYEQCLNNLALAYQRLKMENEARNTWKKLLNKTSNHQLKIQAAEKLKLLEPPLRRPVPFAREFLFKEGVRLHNLAVAGNGKAASSALSLLEKAHQLAPNGPLIQGYYGSAMALAARESMDPGQLFGKTIQALNILKKAIGKDWSNPKLHLLRGYLAFSLPENFFHMSHIAVKDLKFVKNAWENDNKILPAPQYWQLCYDLSTAYERSGDQDNAAKIRAKLQSECQDPKILQLLENNLKG